MSIKDKLDAWIQRRLEHRLEAVKRDVIRKKWQRAQLQAQLDRLKEQHDRQQEHQDN